MSTLKRVRRVPEWKVREVEELLNLIKRYKVVGLADLQGLPCAQMQEIRRKLRGRAVIRVSKNTLIKRAVEKVGGMENRDVFIKYLRGPNALILTNMNPFELYLTLEKLKIPTSAKPGDIAPKDIVIPAGNTGIPPGPILSVFGRLKIPTKIQEGTIWITKNVTVAKAGEVISQDLASILLKLGIMPLEVGMKLKVVYTDGLILESEDLKLDLEEYRENVSEAYLDALKLGMATALPVPEVLELVVKKAFIEALTVSAEAGFITSDTAKHVILKAYLTALSLSSLLSQKAPELGLEVAAQPSAPVAVEEKGEVEEEEEEKEEIGEEELAAGLEALFG